MNVAWASADDRLGTARTETRPACHDRFGVAQSFDRGPYNAVRLSWRPPCQLEEQVYHCATLTLEGQPAFKATFTLVSWPSIATRTIENRPFRRVDKIYND